MINKEIIAVKEKINILDIELAYLTAPERLLQIQAENAEDFNSLRTSSIDQIRNDREISQYFAENSDKIKVKNQGVAQNNLRF